jgi:hypothetical protein
VADITIYKPAGVTCEVIDGNPPVDQSALVAELHDMLLAAQAETAAVQAKLDKLNADIDAAQGQ